MQGAARRARADRRLLPCSWCSYRKCGLSRTGWLDGDGLGVCSRFLLSYLWSVAVLVNGTFSVLSKVEARIYPVMHCFDTRSSTAGEVQMSCVVLVTNNLTNNDSTREPLPCWKRVGPIAAKLLAILRGNHRCASRVPAPSLFLETIGQ